ncbi:hypothetical protein AAC387_Pa06g1432 [Persea americana]
MASSCISRFITEVAPPQIVCVMRQRVYKILDTIVEEERDVGEAKPSAMAKGPSCSAREERAFSICGRRPEFC